MTTNKPKKTPLTDEEKLAKINAQIKKLRDEKKVLELKIKNKEYKVYYDHYKEQQNKRQNEQ